MQNDEYYNAYIKEWNKMLGEAPTVTEAERQELHELIEKQKEGKHENH